MTPKKREKLITKLIEDMVSCARMNSKFGASFIEDAMRHGYTALTDKSDEDLLQWHRDSFDREFK